jgi:hypothetical protein
VHAVLAWRQSEVKHWDPAVWSKGRWDHTLVWLVVWLSEHRHDGNGVLVKTMMCKTCCWTRLALSLRVSHRRQKHAVANGKQWWRSREEHRVGLRVHKVVVRHPMTVWSLNLGMPE